MLRTFPLYQLYLQIPRHHRHKRPLAQLQQVSDVKGWSLSIVLQWDYLQWRIQTVIWGVGGGHPDP